MQNKQSENKNFDLAEEYFEKGNYKTSFKLFYDIAIDSSNQSEIRGDAYNMLGLLIIFDPNLDPDDETGIKYFSKAIEIDPNNLGALLNIIENYGPSINSHHNKDLFIAAFDKLYSLGYKFTDDELKRFEKKRNLSF